MNEKQNKNQLPKDWKWVKLDEVGIISNLSIVPSKYSDEIFELWSVTNFDYDKPEYLKGKEIGSNKCLVKENDVLLCKINPRINRVWKVRKMTKYRQIASTEWIVIRNDLMNQNFLTYQLRCSRIRSEILKDVSGVGGSLMRARPNAVKELKITLPPRDVQNNIVSKIEELFSEFDKGIENLRTAQQQLKTYRQAVLKWAFEGRLTNDNIEEDELPNGWKMVQLNEICKIIGGVTKGRNFKDKTTIRLPYLRVANVQDGYLDLTEMKTIEVLPSDKEKYKLFFGDILYTEGGDKDKLGRGTIWKNEIQDCIHQNHIFRARPLSKNINSKYIAYFSQTKSAKNYFFKHGKQTTNLASINLTILSNLPLPLCSIEQQKNIVEAIESRLSVADKMEETITQSLQQAEALRQSILKKAFEGRLLSTTD